jgi:hypothetical protein
MMMTTTQDEKRDDAISTEEQHSTDQLNREGFYSALAKLEDGKKTIRF